jgi:long-chain acyl-CoA synthetase
VNIAEIILSRAEGSAPAVLDGNSAVTYAQLRRQVTQVAQMLLWRGHYPANRIGLWSENNTFFAAAYLGIIRAGMVAVPFQTESSEATLDRIVSDAGINEILVSNRFLNRLRSWSEKCGVGLIAESSLLIEPRPDALAPISRTPTEVRPNDLAALMFTSGSTGSPKGVMITHRNIESNSRDIIDYLRLNSTDRIMVVLPFHYCYGLSLLHTHLMVGASLVLNNSFKLYPETVLQEMQQKECTGLAGVPSTYQVLLRKSRFRRMSFPRLRWFQQAGGKLPDACIRELLEAFPSVRFFLMYGQTEGTARLSYLPPERLKDKLGSIGKGLPSTRLEVLKRDGMAVVPGSGDTGEIVASGDNIALGYWNDPVESASYFRNNKLHTGDIAHVDEDGFIFIVGRERGMIKTGGNRVSAEEVEEVIAEIPEVVEVAVVGVPHEILGEAIRAFVVMSPGTHVSTRQIIQHCRHRLPGYKVPEEVAFLPAMPHNSSGKIVKAALKDLSASSHSQDNVPVGRT